MTTVGEPTMDGFVWSPAPPYVPMEPGEDGYCVRDAFSELLGWEIGSREWSRFIEGPNGRDVSRLAAHLGLTEFGLPEQWDELLGRSAHPGIAWFIFEAYGKAHTVYVPDVWALLYHWAWPGGLPTRPFPGHTLYSYGWPLNHEYLSRGPELAGVIVDERQPPRLAFG